MNAIHFFKREQIIRDKDFLCTYAVGREIESTIAYANDLPTLNSLNNISSISTIITKNELIEQVIESKGVVVSKNPQKDFYTLHNFMVKEGYVSLLNDHLIDDTAIISPTAKISKNVRIGKNVRIEDFVVIESNTVIGDDCQIDSFAVIGAKGMQRTTIDGQLFHLEYAGGVKIGPRTCILTKAIIQKPYQAFYTTIGNDSVISTNVVIGHGSMIGNNTLLSGNSAIAGNCVVGDEVWIGGGVIVSDGIVIEDKAKVLIGSVVINDVKSNEMVSGNFAFDHKKNLRHQLKLRQ